LPAKWLSSTSKILWVSFVYLESVSRKLRVLKRVGEVIKRISWLYKRRKTAVIFEKRSERVPVDSVRDFFGGVLVEVSKLSEVRASADLEEEPVKALDFLGRILRDQLLVLLGQVQQDVTAFEDRDGLTYEYLEVV